MSKYSMGIDFGTLSARAIIVDIETGEEKATAVSKYEHGIMAKDLMGLPLPADYALQHPKDYIDSLIFVVTECLAKADIDSADIIGIGVDFTSTTLLPVTKDGTPLCFSEKYKNEPHAYVKLWKHHAAQKEADEINALAKETGASWLARYGGIISSEWLFPKVLQILRENETLYNDTFRFIEAADWMVWQLTGVETHSVCTTGFKAIWNDTDGYPDKEFLKKLDPRLENIVGDKLSENILKLSQTAGYITEEIAEKTGLCAGTPVAPAFIDAHSALPSLGITSPGKLLMIMGTSTCHILLGDKERHIPGISGVVKDGILDGMYAYEAGQASVGDSFDWFMENCLPHKYYEEAMAQGGDIFAYMRAKARKLSPGSNGIIALDWWNGNRTPYVNGGLRGLLLGLDINTAPEEIYRALIEATAYGTRSIIDIYEQNGIKIDSIYAAGGIAEKDAMIMQIYADVTGREIHISGTALACAYGSAILGSVNENGYKTLAEASSKMKKLKDISYKPIKENAEVYNEIYKTYKTLTEFFGEKENGIMEGLKKYKKQQ